MVPATWVDLLDPSPKELHDALPESIHESALARLLAPAEHEDEPRPRMDGQGQYVFGVFLVPVVVPEKDEIYYQEVDFVVTCNEVVTVRKTPEHGEPFDIDRVKHSVHARDSAGMITYRLVDWIAEDYLDLVDGLNEEIEELDDHVEDWPAERIRRRISDLRHGMLHIRRTFAPTRDAIREVVDDRIDVEEGTLFPREVEIAFGNAYDKVMRSSEGMEFSRDLLGSVRDYYLSKVANDQNEVMKRLTAIAALLLVPTFIVGLYGQNFRNIPEIRYFGGWGYLWSWCVIIVVTAIQFWYFRRKRWI